MIKIKRITGAHAGSYAGNWWVEICIGRHGFVGIAPSLRAAVIDLCTVIARIAISWLR